MLRGAKVADLPIEQPTNFGLIINLRAAKVIGHEVPAGLVLRADRVVEKRGDFRFWQILLQKYFSGEARKF